MGRSKVVYGVDVLVDLTGDTVEAAALLEGYRAHDKAGDPVVGSLSVITIHVGSGEPSADLGSDDDIYLDMG